MREAKRKEFMTASRREFPKSSRIDLETVPIVAPRREMVGKTQKNA
jgi:hypothetical protein